VASVGWGMSAFAATDADVGSTICRHAPAPAGDPQKPSPAPQCPFCFVAAQCAGLVALAGETLAVADYSGVQNAVAHRIGDSPSVAQFRRTVGDPRGPPTSSV